MTIERRHLNPDAERQLGFCQSVRVGDQLSVSGTVSWDEQLQPLHVGDMAGQLTQVYETLKSALALFDVGFDSVVKETGYTTDMDATLAALGARAAYYNPDALPASTWVEVKRLAHPDLLVEIEIVAAL